VIRDGIARAIREKRLIRLHYDGTGPRTVEPHVLGTRGPKGLLQVHAFQLTNTSKPSRPSWRFFALEEIANLEILTDHFPGRRNDGNYSHVKWAHVVAIVDP
jgi:hypothetical protein